LQSLMKLIFLIFFAALFSLSSGQEVLQEWEWVKGTTITGANQYHYFHYYAPAQNFKFNVTVWPCFGASELFIKNPGNPTSGNADVSNTYQDGDEFASYFAWIQYGLAYGPNATAGVRSVDNYPDTSDSAVFDLVYNNDAAASDANGYDDRVPKPWDIVEDLDSDNDQVHITYKKANTGLGTDVYTYWRFNGSFDSLEKGWVYSTACGVRRFMTQVTPIAEEDVDATRVKATFGVPFKEGFDGNHNFIVMVERTGCPGGTECYEGVYPLIRVKDSAATLTMAVSAVLLFFCVLFALF
jgi:hypothetical protein